MIRDRWRKNDKRQTDTRMIRDRQRMIRDRRTKNDKRQTDKD